MRNLTPLVLVAGLAISLSPANALDNVPTYSPARIGEILAPGDVSVAIAVSDDGDAVGEIWFTGYRQAFVYTYEHGPALLPFIPGHPHARAYDISDRGVDGEVIIVGTATDTFYDEVGIAAYWRYSTVTGEVLEAVEIGTLPGHTQSVAAAVNNDGKVIGRSQFQPIVFDVATGEITPIDFPVVPTDINNFNQIIGGTYLGDLDGNVIDLGTPPDTTGASLSGIADNGFMVGTAGMPYTDGSGHFVNGVVRYTNAWQLLYANSWLDGGHDINSHGDVVGAMGISGAVRPVLFIDAMAQTYLINDLIAPAEPFELGVARSINEAGQIAGGYSAVVLTPLGSMIIPGDVNGNAVVDLDDLCAWLQDPIDLDGDGDADVDDEQWMLDRLATLGFEVTDCNLNDMPDRCDILDGQSADCNENGVPDECEPDCDLDGIPDACEPDCNANGTPDDCDIADGTSQDCNGNGIPDECDGSDTVEYMNTFVTPVLLLPSSTYVDDFLVTSAGDVADVDFRFDIDYRIGYLTVRLTHGGVTITLIDRPGHPDVIQGNGQLGYRITLDDEGTGGPIEDEGNFGSPFEPIESPPSYVPDEPLATFDGMPIDGIWTVEVTTTPDYSPVSAFLAWGLVVTDEAVPVECAPGDINGDGVVDTADLLLLLAGWGPCPGEPGCAGDVDGDGIVGVADLLALLANWT